MGNRSPAEIELQTRIEELLNKLPIFDINNGLEEGRAGRCLSLASAHDLIGTYYTLLSQHAEAEQHLAQPIPLMRQGLSYLPKDERTFQYFLFRHALLLGDKVQVDESAKLISTMNSNMFRLYMHPAFEHAVANIWLKNDKLAENYIQQVRKVEGKKGELYLFPGIAQALTSLLENNKSQLAKDLDEVLLQHFNAYAKYKHVIDLNKIFCESALYIAIVAKHRGLNIKPAMHNCLQTLLLKPSDPSKFPSLKKNGRIEYQVDLMPEFVLSRWAKHNL